MKKTYLNVRQLSPGFSEEGDHLKITIKQDNDDKDKNKDNEDDDETDDKEDDSSDDKKDKKVEKQKSQRFDPDEQTDDDSVDNVDDPDDDKKSDDKKDDKSKKKDDDNLDDDKDPEITLKFDDEDLVDKNIDYTVIGKALNIQLEENNLEAFVQKVNTAIENAKQIVELDTSKYEPETVEFFNYLQGGGSVKDFFQPLAKYDNFLAKTDTEKTLSYLVQIEGLSVKDAQDKLDDLSIAQIGEIASKANAAIFELREAAVKDIVSSKTSVYKTKIQRDTEIREKEEKALIEAVNSLTEFEGVKLSDANRKALIAHVKTGRIQRVLNNSPKQIIEAYLSITQADTIKQLRELREKEIARKGYNTADQKNKDRFTNKKETGSNSGVSKKKDYKSSPLSGFGSKLE